jgi:hypothetical protein
MESSASESEPEDSEIEQSLPGGEHINRDKGFNSS